MKKKFWILFFVICVSMFSVPSDVFASTDSAMVAAQEKIWGIINEYADPEYFLEDPWRDSYSDAQYEELRQAALDAISGCETEYDKIKAITGFVADHVYYDYANYYGDGSTYIDSYNVYKEKRAVCGGYTELMRTMCISVGIPCMYLRGDNHAFNAAYDSDNQKWIVADATWCSNNKYTIDGEWIYGGHDYHLFDLTPVELAKYSNHEIYELTGLQDGIYNEVYYRLDTDEDADYTRYDAEDWSDTDGWYVSVNKIKGKNLKVVGELEGIPVKDIVNTEVGGFASIEEIDLSRTTLTEISMGRFNGASNLKKIVLPKTIKFIGACAFSGCSSLETLDLSKTGITRIAGGAFSECTSLKKIILPKSITAIESAVFEGCRQLEQIDLSSLRQRGVYARTVPGL